MSTFNLDEKRIGKLADLMREKNLRELELEDGERCIRLVRDVAGGPVVAAHHGMSPASPSPAASDAGPPPVAAPAPGGDHPGRVTAPMVGTVYLSAQPGAPAFVTPGAAVQEGDTLVIIEAMKVMNQIPAPRSGVVREILVGDGQPVEFGETLLVLE